VGGGQVLARYSRLYAVDGRLPPFELNPEHVPRERIDVYGPMDGHATKGLVAATSAEALRMAGQQPVDARLARAIREVESWKQTNAREHLDAASSLVKKVLATSPHGLVPHTVTAHADYRSKLGMPWYSAQTQGLLLSALARLAQATGDEQWAAAAKPVFDSLMRIKQFSGNRRRAPDPWLTVVGDTANKGHLWFEATPSRLGNSEVVDAHIVAVFGLYDYWQLTGDKAAAMLFNGGVTSVDRRMQDIRQPGRVALDDLVQRRGTLAEHRVLVRQLALLGQITRDDRFAFYAYLLTKDIA
jgi:hypothetical protein